MRLLDVEVCGFIESQEIDYGKDWDEVMFFCFMQFEIIDEDDEVVFDDFNNDIYIQKYGVWN